MLTTGFIKSSACLANTEPDWAVFNATYSSISFYHVIQCLCFPNTATSCRLSTATTLYTHQVDRITSNYKEPQSQTSLYLYHKHTDSQRQLPLLSSAAACTSHLITHDDQPSYVFLVTKLLQFWRGFSWPTADAFRFLLSCLSCHPAAVHDKKATDSMQSAVSNDVFKLLQSRFCLHCLVCHIFAPTDTQNAFLPPTMFLPLGDKN